MNQKRIQGFGLLEVLLAVVVITIAGLGAYALFDSGVKSSKITDATDQVVQIANVYTDLSSADLTENITGENIPALLQNSGRLSNKYFSSSSGSVQMYNAFGALDFPAGTATSFSIDIPLGCVDVGSTMPKDFFNKVQDQYSCTAEGSKNFDDCAQVAPCKGPLKSTLTLYFNMNNS